MRMTEDTPPPPEFSRVLHIGDILIPGAERMPSFSAVHGIDRLIQLAVAGSKMPAAQLAEAIRIASEIRDFSEAQRFAESKPDTFALLAQIVTAAYYMADEVLTALSYPLERRNPAGVSDFADEYMTGILDPVVENNRGAS